MEIVNNAPQCWEFIRTLRNLDGVREGFIQQKHIDSSTHQAHMEKHGDCYYICLKDDTPIGYTGILEADIRIATHPNHQKKGVGKFMINKLMKICPTAVAKIKMENHASVALFDPCGFVKKYYILEQEENK